VTDPEAEIENKEEVVKIGLQIENSRHSLLKTGYPQKWKWALRLRCKYIGTCSTFWKM